MKKFTLLGFLICMMMLAGCASSKTKGEDHQSVNPIRSPFHHDRPMGRSERL